MPNNVFHAFEPSKGLLQHIHIVKCRQDKDLDDRELFRRREDKKKEVLRIALLRICHRFAFSMREEKIEVCPLTTESGELEKEFRDALASRVRVADESDPEFMQLFAHELIMLAKKGTFKNVCMELQLEGNRAVLRLLKR